MQYKISGKVIKGDGYGRKLGFPTVNLEIRVEHTEETPPYVPPEGVYAGFAVLNENEDKEPQTRASSVRGRYRAGIVVGPNNKIEAHLIGYNGNAYGKEVILQIKKFLRSYKKFDTEKELIIQIKKDLKLC